MQIRIPTKIELALQGLLGAFLALMLADLFQALDATACSDPNPSRDCYPWGMTEGPMEGGSWNYSSKANYLISGAVSIVVLVAAALAPFFARDRRNGLTTLGGILVLGWLGFRLATVQFAE